MRCPDIGGRCTGRECRVVACGEFLGAAERGAGWVCSEHMRAVTCRERDGNIAAAFANHEQAAERQ